MYYKPYVVYIRLLANDRDSGTEVTNRIYNASDGIYFTSDEDNDIVAIYLDGRDIEILKNGLMKLINENLIFDGAVILKYNDTEDPELTEIELWRNASQLDGKYAFKADKVHLMLGEKNETT